MNAVTETAAAEPVSGVEIFVPLAKLKKSPRNARKVPHGEAAIEALAASIQHKGMIQNLVVEPEVKDGEPTGCYFVTAGEGRRLAMLLRAKRKQIKKSEPVRCWLRFYPEPVELTDEDEARQTEASAEYDALIEDHDSGEYDTLEDFPEAVCEKLAALEAEIDAISAKRSAYEPQVIANGGAFVILNHDGTVKIERGFVRPEDAALADPQPEDEGEGEGIEPEAVEAEQAGDDDEDMQEGEEEEDEEPGKPISDSLTRDLSAHRTLALRVALGERPDLALIALTHTLTAQLFYSYAEAGCLEVRPTVTPLGSHADGIEDTPLAARANEAREAWAERMPRDVADLWGFIVELDDEKRLALLAHCASCNWIVTLQEQPDDAGVRRRFELWRTASAANAVAWEEVAQVYAGIGETTPAHAERWRKLAADREPSLAPPIVAARRRRRMRGAASRGEPRKGRRIAAVALPAAAAAVLAIVAIPDAVLRWQADAVTGTAELRDVHLSDGSLASLGPDSAIGIDYSQGERQIRLLRGQAWFDVRHNADRPFRVVARGVETTDIGTAFEVRLDPSDTHVSVARGIVQVDYAKSAPPISARLVAGQSLAIATNGGATRDMTQPALVGAWRDGQLAVQNQPLGDVIDALRPWYSGAIVVRSDTLADRRVTGVYDLRDPAGAMTALAQAYGGHVTRITPWLMILSDG